MQLSYKQLETYLNQKPLLPVYLICGDVPLLVEETSEAIRQHAKKEGFIQRQLFFIESGFPWESLTHTIDHLSLFSEKTLIEIRNHKAKFEPAGIQILSDYLNNPPHDKRLLIITQKLTAAQQKTQWYKAIDRSGAIISLWPLTTIELPKWIEERLKKANLRAIPESMLLLAKLTEGNLLATDQAIEKLKLLYPDKLITPDMIATIINDNANFNVFDLAEAALTGDPSRVIRILSKLRFSDEQSMLLILWVLTRELRTLYSLTYKLQHGTSLNQLMTPIWHARRPSIKKALSRLTIKTIAQLLQQAKNIDHMIKGIIVGNPWEALESLSLKIAGIEAVSMPLGSINIRYSNINRL